MSLLNGKFCSKHPQDRVVGVCGACLATRLTSLISAVYDTHHHHSNSVVLCLTSSPPPLIISPADHQLHHHHPLPELPPPPLSLSSINEAAGQPPVSTSLATQHILLLPSNPPACRTDASAADAQHVIDDVRHSRHVDDKNSISEQEIHAQKEKSKSPCISREGLDESERVEHDAATVVRTRKKSTDCTKKVTLRALFQIDDEEKRRNSTLVPAQMTEFETGEDQLAGICKLEQQSRGPIDDAEQIDEQKDASTRDNNRGCVPSVTSRPANIRGSVAAEGSTETLSSSVCPFMSGRIKHSVCLDSWLCRKTRDGKTVMKRSGSMRKPSQVHEETRHNQIPSDGGGFVRANYITHENRGHEIHLMRRCRSKLERFTPSFPASPPCLVSHVVDSKSERKFNLTARALAVNFSSGLWPSMEAISSVSRVSAEASAVALSVSREDHDRITGEVDMGVEETEMVDGSLSVVTNAAMPMDMERNTRNMWDDTGEMDMEDEIEMVDGSSSAATSMDRGRNTKDSASSIVARQVEAGGNTKDQPAHTDGAKDQGLCEEMEMRRMQTDMREADAAAATDEMMEMRVPAHVEEEEQGRKPTEDLRIPTYITTKETFPIQLCRSVSCNADSGNTAVQKVSEYRNPYKTSGRGAGLVGRTSVDATRYKSPSTRTVKIGPDQSGLLRFYLTPLRSSGRTKFPSSRRPPKRHFWSLVFFPKL